MENCGHVLLVDDEAMVRQSTEQWLKMCGFTVDSYASAELALKVLDDSFSGVVVTDVVCREWMGLN